HVSPCRARYCRTASRGKAVSRRAAIAAARSASPLGRATAMRRSLRPWPRHARMDRFTSARLAAARRACRAPSQEPASTDYHSPRDPLSAGERTDLLRRLNDAVAQKYPGLLNADLVLSSD